MSAMVRFLQLWAEECSWRGGTKGGASMAESPKYEDFLNLFRSACMEIHGGPQGSQDVTKARFPPAFVRIMASMEAKNDNGLMRNLTLSPVIAYAVKTYEANAKLTLHRNRRSVLYTFFASYANFFDFSLKGRRDDVSSSRKALRHLSSLCCELSCPQDKLDAVLAPLTWTNTAGGDNDRLRFLPPGLSELLRDPSCSFGVFTTAELPFATDDAVDDDEDEDEDEECDEYDDDGDFVHDVEDSPVATTPSTLFDGSSPPLVGYARLNQVCDAMGCQGKAILPQQRGGIPKHIPVAEKPLYHLLYDVAANWLVHHTPEDVGKYAVEAKTIRYGGDISQYDKAYRAIVDRHGEAALRMFEKGKTGDLFCTILNPKSTNHPKTDTISFFSTNGISISLLFEINGVTTKAPATTKASAASKASATDQTPKPHPNATQKFPRKLLDVGDVDDAIAALEAIKSQPQDPQFVPLAKVLNAKVQSLIEHHGVSVKSLTKELQTHFTACIQGHGAEPLLDFAEKRVAECDVTPYIQNRVLGAGIDPNQRQPMVAYGQGGHYRSSAQQFARDSGQLLHRYLDLTLRGKSRSALGCDQQHDGEYISLTFTFS